MEEIWRDIKGYEGLYKVSNYGRFFGIKKKRIKTLSCGDKGYYYVELWKNNIRQTFRVNRVVYETFIGSIPYNYEVNHIDEDKSNNSVWNLNLLTAKDNANWGTRNERMIDTRNKNKSLNSEKAVLQYTKDGQFVAEYKSLIEAERQTKIKWTNISRVCRGVCGHKTAGGYIWKYKEVA